MFSVLLGAAGLAVITFAITHQRLDFIDFFRYGGFGILIGMMPFFWIGFFGVFIGISFWGVQHTKKAYRIPRSLLVFGNLALTIILGTVFYTSDQVEAFERGVVRHMPFMDTVREGRIKRWEKPDKGFAGGEVVSIETGFVQVKTRKGSEIQIQIEDAEWRDGLSLDVLEVGQHVRAVGKRIEKGVFKAKGIGPFDPQQAKELRKKRGPGRGERRDGERPREGHFEGRPSEG